MNDKRLAELAERYSDAKRVEAESKEAASALGRQLNAEMQRRGTKGIVTGGWKITRVTPETVVYDEGQLRRRLKGKFVLVTKQVVDPALISAAIQEGEISPTLVNKCSTVVPKASYVLVNPA